MAVASPPSPTKITGTDLKSRNTASDIILKKKSVKVMHKRVRRWEEEAGVRAVVSLCGSSQS